MNTGVPAALHVQAQQRAKRRCEYCLEHEDGAVLPHEPDHIIACKHGGQTHGDNLAWTCFACNRHKGSDLASINSETGRIVRLFLPRRDKWARHFRLEGARIIPLTAVGRVTAQLLQFNRPDRVRVRGRLIAAGRYPR